MVTIPLFTLCVIRYVICGKNCCWLLTLTRPLRNFGLGYKVDIIRMSGHHDNLRMSFTESCDCETLEMISLGQYELPQNAQFLTTHNHHNHPKKKFKHHQNVLLAS